MRTRGTVPAWVSLLVLLFAGLLVAAPGPANQLEGLGTHVIAPLQFGVSGALGSVARLAETVRHAGELRAQNAVYREEVDRLRAMVIQMRELELENQDLRRLLDLRQRTTLGSLLSVNVIGQDPLSIIQAVTVDRGSSDGVVVGAPVITWRGLVGRVVEVHPSAARVLLITDVNSAVSARIQDPDSRTTGIARGTGDGRLLLQYVPRMDPLRTEDVAITSGAGGTFPSGLVIGRVLQARQKDVDVFQEALLEPAVDMRNLERLYVVLRPADSFRGPVD